MYNKARTIIHLNKYSTKRHLQAAFTCKLKIYHEKISQYISIKFKNSKPCYSFNYLSVNTFFLKYVLKFYSNFLSQWFFISFCLFFVFNLYARRLSYTEI